MHFVNHVVLFSIASTHEKWEKNLTLFAYVFLSRFCNCRLNNKKSAKLLNDLDR